jgi:hypothetical protein
MTWSIVTLPRSAEWVPNRLLSSDELTWLNSAWPQIQLGELVAAAIPASGLADDGQPVVTPGGLSRNTGQVVRTNSHYAGRIYEMQDDTDSLMPDDLLVPRYYNSPALVVAEAHNGLAFAGSFHALRCVDHHLTVWLWAVLSSGIGQRARADASTAAKVPLLTRGRLLELPVPVPPEQEMRERLETLHPLFEGSQLVDMRRHEVHGSWWRIADLHGADRWDVFVVLAEPDLLRSGVPLAELCEEMVVGKAVRDHVLPAPQPDWPRVYTSRSVRAGHIDDLWLDPSVPAVVAEPGDLLIPYVGATGLSTLSTQRAAVDRNIILCRLRDQRISETLVNYLNSDRGQSVRRVLVHGQPPSLTLKIARQFPIPMDIAFGEGATSDDVGFLPLSARLDDLLWR